MECIVAKVKWDVTALRVELLGPVRAWRGEEELELGGPQRRALLSMLAGSRRPVSIGEVIDGLWGQDPPASAGNAVHVHLSWLRRVLEPDRARRSPGQILTAAHSGYRLDLTPGSLDTEVLDFHLATARRLAASDPAVAVRSLDAALSLWHGASLDGIPGPWSDVERARLDELYQTATGDRLDMLLMLGAHHEVLADLAALIRKHRCASGSAASSCWPCTGAGGRPRRWRRTTAPAWSWPGNSASTPGPRCAACTRGSSRATRPLTRHG